MKTLAIAHNTAREALRNKVLYSIVGFALLVAAAGALFGSASIGNQAKFVKDFSLMAISLFGVVIAVTIGVSMLHQELGRRTILNILSKPVARWQFILGKFLGLVAVLACMVALMSGVLIAALGVFEGRLDWGLGAAAAMVLLELMVVVAAALFFSAVVVTPALAGMFTIAAFVAGRSSGYLGFFQDERFGGTVRGVARGLYWVLPHLDRFNITDQVVYGDALSLTYVATAAAYGLAYTALLLLLTVGLFSRREFV
jgi:ABC-type transport system involved in multi-copper enzyme maturation permease subunit